MSEDRNLVQAVLKALEILEALCEEKQTGIRDLSQKVGLNRSTVNRLVATLERAGYVAQERERGKYRASLKLFELGNQILQHLDIREQAYPVMQKLAEETAETINLAILDGDQVIYILKIDSPHMLKSSAPVGSHPPIHCNASGKVILAYLPEKKQQLVLPPVLASFTPHTIVSFDALKTELASVRTNGYAVDNEEWSLNTRAVAAPVWDYNGRITAALTIAGPSVRITSQRMGELIPFLREAADELSSRLGYRAART